VWCNEDLLDGSHIEDAVAKSSECDGGVADISLVGERHLQDGDVSHNRRRDCGDEEQNRCHEEQEGADMMENARLRHFDLCC
jgi:hypothetical protein